MIAARPFHDLARGLGRNAFDLPVAALAGLAVAFLAFAMPSELLGRLILATGLPHLLAAAAPPLGFKARALLGVAGAGAAFGLAYLLLRRLDNLGRAKARAQPKPSAEGGPKLRRRDSHPDAPVCRPISAARDFGEPAPPQHKPDVPAHWPDSVAPDSDAPAPLWLEPATPACAPISTAPDLDGPTPPPAEPDAPVSPAISVAPEPEALTVPPPEPVAPAAPWLGDAEGEIGDAEASDEESSWSRRRDLYSGTPARQPISAIPAFANAMPAQAAELAEPAASARAATPAWLPEPANRKAAEPVPAPPVAPIAPAAPVIDSMPEPVPAAPAERAREAAAEPVFRTVAEPASGPVTEASLSELMRRFEHGLARRRTGRSFAAAPQPQAPQVFPEANDDRLQSAIESLQRFAARGE